MTNFTIHFRQNLQVYIAMIYIVCMPYISSAIEPIATIGQPTPMQHAFLNNGTILRVVPTHIEIVDANTGEVVDKFGNLTSYYSDVVFSPDSSHLAIQNYSQNSKRYTIYIWDVNAREQITELELEDNFQTAAFSPTKSLLAISIDDEIYLWNWQTGENLEMMIGERRPSDTCYYVNGRWRSCRSPARDYGLVFSPDGRYLIVASMRPDIELWNVETRQLEGHIEGHTGNWVDGVAISPDGTLIASFDRIADSIYVWHMKAQHLLWKAKNGIGNTSAITFSPDSKRLYVASRTGVRRKSGTNPWEGWDDRVRVWDAQSGQQVDTLDTKFRSLNEIALSPDGNILLMHFLDGVVLWDIGMNQQRNVWTDFVGRWFYTEIMLSPDGKAAVSVSPHFIKIWDVASQQLQHLISAEDYKFEGFAFSPDSKTFAVSKNPWVELRNVQTGEVETLFSEYVLDSEQVVFSPSGRWVGAANYRGEIVILDSEKPETIQRVHRRIENNSPAFYNIAFSDNDEYFVASGQIRQNNNSTPLIRLWKRVGDTFVFQYELPIHGFGSTPAFLTTEDGSIVLAAPGKEINIWKILPENLELLTTLNGEGPVQFSPDGRYLFANWEEHFQIWDWKTNRQIRHSSYPRYVSLSQDGSVMMSPDYDTDQYMIWNVKDMLSLLPYPVEPKGKQFVTLGQIKRNQLLQNFPNPFNPETWIPFQLADKSDVTIRIYTPTGKLVRSLSPGTMSAGDYSSQSQAVHWDGRNNEGESVSSGFYLYTINAGNFSATRKMLIKK